MIDRALASFLEEGLGIHVGTRNGRLEPNGARAIAVKVDEDGVHLEVFLARTAAERLLPDLESNGQAAISFARPPDDRACQVKGQCTGIREASDAERAFVDAQRDRFVANLEYIGIPRAAVSGWTSWPAVAVRVRVTAIFAQTPGPGAGAPLA